MWSDSTNQYAEIQSASPSNYDNYRHRSIIEKQLISRGELLQVVHHASGGFVIYLTLLGLAGFWPFEVNSKRLMTEKNW